MTINSSIKARYVGGKRSMADIKYIVMHYTANNGTSATAKGNANYFANPKDKASAHYVVDDASIYQCVDDLITAFAVGGNKYSDCAETGGGKLYGKCTNANSISIEMVSHSNSSGYYITDKTINNAIWLVRELKRKYPGAVVCRHFDVTGKRCPATHCVTPQGEVRWNWFFKRLEDEPMTAEERKELDGIKGIISTVGAEIQQLKNAQEKVYNYIWEIPEWGKETIMKLIDKGYLGGTDKGLNIPETLLRVLVVNDRAGLYK